MSKAVKLFSVKETPSPSTVANALRRLEKIRKKKGVGSASYNSQKNMVKAVAAASDETQKK